MFILTLKDKKEQGAYAVQDGSGNHVLFFDGKVYFRKRRDDFLSLGSDRLCGPWGDKTDIFYFGP